MWRCLSRASMAKKTGMMTSSNVSSLVMLSESGALIVSVLVY